MPRPASTSARRHDSTHLPPSYQDHDTAPKHPDSLSVDPPSQPTPPPTDSTVHSSLLQPRVAVALGLSAKWHPLLFICRLLSILPALWWGVPVALRLLVQLIALLGNTAAACSYDDRTQGIPWLRDYGRIAAADLRDVPQTIDFETRLRLTEMALGIVWVNLPLRLLHLPKTPSHHPDLSPRLTKPLRQCSSSAYLSFTFTDCLMSRWLLLYTPQATLVRLLAINLTNTYLTSQTLHLTGAGGTSDPRLFLPAWITIATTLTGLYHLTQRKINIRKETRLSISVFSVASFVSMVALLAALQTGRPEWPRVPAVEAAARAWAVVVRMRDKIGELGGGGGGGDWGRGEL